MSRIATTSGPSGRERRSSTCSADAIRPGLRGGRPRTNTNSAATDRYPAGWPARRDIESGTQQRNVGALGRRRRGVDARTRICSIDTLRLCDVRSAKVDVHLPTQRTLARRTSHHRTIATCHDLVFAIPGPYLLPGRLQMVRRRWASASEGLRGCWNAEQRMSCASIAPHPRGRIEDAIQ